MGRVRRSPEWQLSAHAERAGIEMHLSSIESLFIGLTQRRLDADQVERFAQLLQFAEAHVLAELRRQPRRAA